MAMVNTIHRGDSGPIFGRVDDRYVPVRMPDLTDALSEDVRLSGDATIAGLVDAIRNVIRQESLVFHQAVLDEYADVNPDRDTLPQEDLEAHRTEDHYSELAAQARYLLAKANFEQLTQEQIADALRQGNSRGLRVRLRPGVVDWFAIWVRGRVERVHRRRTWRHLHRGEAGILEVYRRLVLVTRLSGDPYLHIKMFKDIPVGDVEALLPHADVQMNLLDRLFLWGGGLGMIGTTASKVAGALSGMIVVSRLAWVILFGATVATFRTVMGYKSARTKRISQRTQHLYYQNLSNNAGAIHSLIFMIAQEEIKETLLAYVCCLVHNGVGASACQADQRADEGGMGPVTSTDELRDRVEAYVDTRFGVAVDFDVEDAIESLTRLGLWEERSRFVVVPPDQAVAKLHAHWQQRLSATYHCGQVDSSRR